MKTTLARNIFCIAALSCTALWSARAANLVADPGFEASADGTGAHPFSASWTDIDASGFSGVGGSSLFAHSGDNYAFLGASPGFGSLNQSLGTTTGQAYNLSFWLANDAFSAASGNSFRVLFGGVQVFSLTNQSSFGYTQYSVSGLVATSASTTLEFVYNNNDDNWRLDDISVDAVVAQGVPEGFATLWLALPAFGLLGLAQFNSQKARQSSAGV